MEDKIILEVGVSDGFDTDKLNNLYKLPIYGFEPVPYLHEKLKEKFKHNENVHIYEAAIDLEDGVRDFYISNPQGTFGDGTNRTVHPYGCSSLYSFSDNIHEKWPGRPDFNTIETIQVKTINLESFFDSHNFVGEIVYMHCDAQGNDVNVLKSLGKYLDDVKEGKIEVAAVTQLYKGTNNTIDEAITILKEHDFNVSRPSIGRSHEADIKFKKR